MWSFEDPLLIEALETINIRGIFDRKYKDYVYRKMLVQEYLKK